jgi:imidazolonepropionase-like amidohydrolase
MQRLGLTLVQLTPAQQTLESSASKTLKGVRLAREYMSYGFTTLRDLGTADPEWPTVDLRNAINAGLVEGPRLVAATHIVSASAGHCDLRGFCNARWNLPVSAIADDAGSIKSQVGANTPLAVTGLKPQTLAGSFSAARDGPARVT